MNKTLKYILIIVVVLAIIAMLVFSNILKGVEIGAIFASMAGGFAVFKSKLFDPPTSVAKQITQVEDEHSAKRQEWKTVKEEFDSKYNALKARMDYIDYKSALISHQIKELDDVEKAAIANNHNLSEEEILSRLRNF